jgi:ferritin-like metal-binding protein YciE
MDLGETPIEVLRRWIDDAVAAETSFETQLRSFSREGDDSEVQELFRVHADQTRAQYQRLTERLKQLDGSPSKAKSWLAHLLGLFPRSAQIAHQEDERVAQNLIATFALESAECAMYEALAAVAKAAGDAQTEHLAREIKAEERDVAAKIWHLLPSRSKIAYNMLTAGEIDPAIETKVADDRLVNP